MNSQCTICYERITALRNKRKMTLEKLAELTGIPMRTIASWKKRLPSGENLITLSKFFDVSIDYILGTTIYRTIRQNEKVFTGSALEFFHFYENLSLNDNQYKILHRTIQGMIDFNQTGGK